MRVGLGQNVVRLLKFYVINQCDSLDLQERFLVCTFVNFEDKEKENERCVLFTILRRSVFGKNCARGLAASSGTQDSRQSFSQYGPT